MKLLLYCTKSNKKLFYDKVKQAFMYGLDGKNDKFNSLNGKIVAECEYEIEEIVPLNWKNGIVQEWYPDDLLEKSCLTAQELYDYLNIKNGYAIYLKNLHIFDEPRELNDYYNNKDNFIKEAPQNMMIVYDRFGNKYVLISIHPEHLCKELNGEKTIELRKKVLKEMINDK